MERRRASDRRKVARGGNDRRAIGPATAVKLAKLRLTRDTSWILENIRKGNWGEVARVAGGLTGEAASILGSIATWPLALAGRDLPPRVTALDAALPLRAKREGVRREAAPKPKPLIAGADDAAPRGAPLADARDGAARPVILVHGWFHNRSAFLLMKRRLTALGRTHVYAVDLPTGRMGVQRLAAILAEKIDHVREVTGAKHVDVVAHSLGGLVARWWMHHLGGDEVVKHLVTLGSPNQGTALAAFVPVGSGRAINPGSWTIAALAVPPPRGVRVTVIWSEMDYLILPLETADWHDEEGHVRMKYVGHLSLLYSKDVFREVWRGLGGSDADGSTPE